MKSKALLLFLFISIFSFAQSNSIVKPFIEVVGTSEKEIIPDEIYLDIFLNERMEKGQKVNLEYLENQLKQELKNLGIPENNLFIADVNAVIAKTGWFTKEQLSKAKYSLKVNSAVKLKMFFDCLDDLKITKVNIAKATHSKITELREENRINAIKAAKNKAIYLLNAIDEKVGKSLIVNEINNKNNQNFATANTLQVNNYSAGISKINRGQSIIQFEKIVIKTSIYVKFAIE
ncbi:SIMPL domain-containing protein [uncultured Polaribacter sp.]|uniref:SIMPL domain-containing protein n=1 Tax=uncultured Polaribacter sp. TaxID=174711 RepID=UPI0026048985|nr:SIMPL domain-containing protein [uncultured Polaribacter sp.]